MVRRVLVLGVATVVAVAIAVAFSFSRDMRRAADRLEGASTLVAAPFGTVEYAEGGSGEPVLVVHGSGGGFDQGALLARSLLGERHRWIAPSRFGYLRSTVNPGATFDDQAHAFAFLLDHLGLPRVHVIAFSHGGPSALLFALLHPERVASLTLVSAGVASSTDAAQGEANAQGDALTAIFQSDLAYWSVTTGFRGRFLELMGAPREVVQQLSPEQRALADELIEFMNPVSRRAAGVSFDHLAALPDARIEGIRAPTLVLHASDDTLQLFRNAQFAATHVPGAQLRAFARGGHLLVAVEQDAVRALVAEHLARHPLVP